MRHELKQTDETLQYAEAYTAHYSTRDLPLALKLYRQVLASHPASQEADYAEMQVQNMVNAIVPKQELQDAQITLLLDHFERDGGIEATQIPMTPLAVGPSIGDGHRPGPIC